MQFLDDLIGSAGEHKPRQWFVLFWHFYKPRWWTPRYQHVSAISAVRGGWLHISIERCGPVVDINPDEWLEEICLSADVVEWSSRPKMSHGWPMSCVSHTASLIGAPGALSPTGFKRILLRNGGREIHAKSTQAIGGRGPAPAD